MCHVFCFCFLTLLKTWIKRNQVVLRYGHFFPPVPLASNCPLSSFIFYTRLCTANLSHPVYGLNLLILSMMLDLCMNRAMLAFNCALLPFARAMLR